MAQEVTPTSDVLFILDGSGSMWGRVNDVEKIVVAKEVLTGLIEGLPEAVNPGLITYGHRERGSCADIELIATPGETSRADLLSALSGITPLGKTPISDSLLRAGELMRLTEDPVSIVLVSDGIESCEGDPCATAALLREQNIDVRIHVVGFDVDAEAQEQLSCIAQAGGGEYYAAGSADTLNDALVDVRTTIIEETVVVLPEPEPETTVLTLPVGNVALAEDVLGGVDVLDEATGELQVRLAGTIQGQVDPGTYTFAFDHFTSPPFTVEAGEEYIIAAADYGLARVALDGAQIGGVDLIKTETNEMLLRLAGTLTKQIAPGTYILEFDTFTSPAVIVAPNSDNIFSALDYALIDVALDGTQAGGVDVINHDNGEKLIRLAGTATRQIPPGVYRFEFDNFVSPPRTLEADTAYIISPSDYELADVALDGTQFLNVDVLDSETGDRIATLSGTNADQIPPGTYRFEFANFLSPPRMIAPNSSSVISPSDYDLVTVSKTRELSGSLDLVANGERVARLTGIGARMIPPGVYTLVHKNNEIGEVTLEPNEVRVFDSE